MKKILFLILVFGFSINSFGDTWRNPEITDYYSENGQYVLRVFPTEIPKNYSKWKAAKQKRKKNLLQRILR